MAKLFDDNRAWLGAVDLLLVKRAFIILWKNFRKLGKDRYISTKIQNSKSQAIVLFGKCLRAHISPWPLVFHPYSGFMKKGLEIHKGAKVT